MNAVGCVVHELERLVTRVRNVRYCRLGYSVVRSTASSLCFGTDSPVPQLTVFVDG
jgi:hypothetical protein